MIIIIRSEYTDSFIKWEGKNIWFSSKLTIQLIYVEDGQIVIQVTPEHNNVLQEDGTWIVAAYGEDPNTITKAQRLLPFHERLKNRQI